MHADLQRLLAADLLADFQSKPLERLRGIRIELTEAEGDVSFVRRVTQGRLDIVGHEVERRADGSRPSGEPSGVSAGQPPAADQADPSSLLFDMPDILADGGSNRPGSGRAAAVLEPGPIALALAGQLDSIAAPSQLAGIQSVDQPTLADLFDSMREFELELSAVRHELHQRIDTIQDEIARRYRDGEASVDALLTDS